MEKDTVIISLETYNELRDFKKEVGDNKNNIVISLGRFLSNKYTTTFVSPEESVKTLIEDNKKLTEDNKKLAEENNRLINEKLVLSREKCHLEGKIDRFKQMNVFGELGFLRWKKDNK